MEKYLFVEADTNDGDYVARLEKISSEELEKYIPLLKQIKKKRGKWETKDCEETPLSKVYPEFSEDLIENFDDMYVPYNEYGVHTIVELKVLEVSKVTNII